LVGQRGVHQPCWGGVSAIPALSLRKGSGSAEAETWPLIPSAFGA
jgi:hypothetical protein